MATLEGTHGGTHAHRNPRPFPRPQRRRFRPGAYRPSNRPRRGHRAQHRHRARQGRAEEEQERGSEAVRRADGRRPPGRLEGSAGAPQEAERDAGGQPHQPGPAEAGQGEKAKLAKLKGKAFDKEYINHEVAYHKAVIDAVKNTLIPNAKNEQLKQLLTDAGPTLEGHLKHAENVQAKLGGSSDTSAARK